MFMEFVQDFRSAVVFTVILLAVSFASPDIAKLYLNNSSSPNNLNGVTNSLERDTGQTETIGDPNRSWQILMTDDSDCTDDDSLSALCNGSYIYDRTYVGNPERLNL